LTVNSPTRLTVRSPAHAAGLVDVRVTSLSGTSPVAVADQYTYAPAPTVSSVSPRSGRLRGGQTVTITGTDFTGVTFVRFGPTPATILTVAPRRITVRSPRHATGPVNVRVTTASGTSRVVSRDRYNYA
jgi:hypothetical protein